MRHAVRLVGLLALAAAALTFGSGSASADHGIIEVTARLVDSTPVEGAHQFTFALHNEPGGIGDITFATADLELSPGLVFDPFGSAPDPFVVPVLPDGLEATWTWRVQVPCMSSGLLTVVLDFAENLDEPGMLTFPVFGGSCEPPPGGDQPLHVDVFGAGNVVNLGVPPEPDGTRIRCPVDCDELYPTGSPEHLLAMPAPGWQFGGWGPACPTPASATCDLIMGSPKNVEAFFRPLTTNLVLTPEPFGDPDGPGGLKTINATVGNPGSGPVDNVMVDIELVQLQLVSVTPISVGTLNPGQTMPVSFTVEETCDTSATFTFHLTAVGIPDQHAGPFPFPVDPFFCAGFGEIEGTKWNDLDGDGVMDAGEPPLAGVTICVPAAGCQQTDGNGHYSFTVPAGFHTVYEQFFPPFVSTTPQSVNVNVGIGQTVTVDFGNRQPTAPPEEVTVDQDFTGPGGLPGIFRQPTEFTKDVTTHCGAGSPVAVKLVLDPTNGPNDEVMMTNVGGEIWSATINPSGNGVTTLTFYVDCPPDTPNFPEQTTTPPMSFEDEIQQGGNIYIDPSGTVVDACTGDPIDGATVTLLKETGGIFVVPSTGDHMPATNPQVTGPDGAYAWVVVEGVWQLHAEAPGYLPTDSAALSIPPAVTGLELALTPTGGCVAHPPNDNFADAINLAGNSGSISGTTIDSTNEPGEPTGHSTGVWYSWTPLASGEVDFNTCGGVTNYDSYLDVYTGSDVGALTPIASNDDACGLQSRVMFVFGGATYRIRVGGFSSSTGNFTLNWSVAEPPPPPVIPVGPGALVDCATPFSLARNDDGSSPLQPVGFDLNFFGTTYNQLYINNNGNVTFDSPLSTFTPFELTQDTPPIIAAFFGDVDTRNTTSEIVRWGNIIYQGRAALCINWTGVGVGYFSQQADKLNSFQILLVDRSDVSAGDFDIVFNYAQIHWETGDASGGVDGLGGTSAGVGYSAGDGFADHFFQLPGSLVPGSFLDSNLGTGLINNSLNTFQLGRYIFPIRNGGAQIGTTVDVEVTGSDPQPGAPVQLCPDAGGTCRTRTTNAQGVASFPGVEAGDYAARAFPPAGDTAHGPSMVQPVDVTGTIPTELVALQLTSPTPLPADIEISPTIGTAPGGIPVVYWSQALTIKKNDRCAGGTADFEILVNGIVVRSGPMIEGPLGDYTGTSAPLIPNSGLAFVRIEILCPGNVVDLQEFSLYIDPSGNVIDPLGNPVPGATVTLFRSDTGAPGSFAPVPDGSALMSPSNRTNPDLTDGAGHFGWDVIAGFYFVRAEKAGCGPPVDTPFLTIPPPVTDLVIVLACPPPPDTEAPVPDQASLPTVTGECGATIASAPTATDAVDGAIVGTTTDPLSYSAQGTFVVTWAYTDASSNTSIQTQNVVVDDVTAPVPDVSPLPTIVGQGSATIPAAPTATDNCVGALAGTTVDALTYTTPGTFTVVWHYDDGHGNVASQSQLVVVEPVDAEPPVPDQASLPTVTGQCSATIVSQPTATDAVDGPIVGTTTDPLSYSTQGTFTVTWAYTDASSNTSIQMQTVVVDDVTAPVPDVSPLPTIVGQGSATIPAAPMATDNCVGAVTGTTVDALTYTTPGTFTVVWHYDDGHGNVASQSQLVVVEPLNQPPTVQAHGPYSVNEGGSVMLNATGSDPDGDPLSYAWDLDNNGSFETPGQSVTFSAAGRDGPSNQDVRVRATDDDDAFATDGAGVTILNVAPDLLLSGPGSVNESPATVTYSYSATDPGGLNDPLTFSFTCGPGGFLSPGSVTGSTFGCVFPDGPASPDVDVTVDDGDGGSNRVAIGVNVANVAPTVTVTGPALVDEGPAERTYSYTVSDPAGPNDPLDISRSCGSGGALVPGSVTAGSFRCVFADGPADPDVAVTADDGDGGVTTDTVDVHVENVAPAVGPLSGPADPVAVGAAATISGNWTDPGVNDTQTAAWDWGDGTTSTTTAPAGGSGTVSDTHTYAVAGVYTVTLTLTDKDGGQTTAIFQFVTVFSGTGFVTGGGQINSPAGAYAPNPTLTGKATFGFVSKYLPGRTRPDGNTQFQFHAGGFNFHSSSYDFLVVSGWKAQYRGVGTVNGEGGYSFIVTAYDGQRPGGDDIDKFRIKVWNADGIVYDNKLGASDSIDTVPQALAKGSIVIHRD